jgi:hypothetical protein
LASEPPNLPIGVRSAPAITISVMESLRGGGRARVRSMPAC